MRDTAHAVLEARARIVFPRIAVTAADGNVLLAQLIDERDRVRQFRSERHSLNHIALLEQRPVHPSRRFPDQTCALCPRFRFGNKRAFDMNAGNLFDRRFLGANFINHLENGFGRRGRSC